MRSGPSGSDRAAGKVHTHIMNGVVVAEAEEASLRSGKILMQSEGAEIFFQKSEDKEPVNNSLYKGKKPVFYIAGFFPSAISGDLQGGSTWITVTSLSTYSGSYKVIHEILNSS